jgi:DNA-directed RNA polymerase specialized sigma24 family protein
MAEKSIKDIHQITGMSVSNIKVSLHRARKKLAEKL